MKLLLTFLSILVLSIPSTLGSDSTNQSIAQRDTFIRELVITLIKTKAAHVTVNQHVETAFAAWQHYQKLANHE